MINLLPPKAKKQNKQEYVWRLAVVYFALLVVAFGGGFALLAFKLF